MIEKFKSAGIAINKIKGIAEKSKEILTSPIVIGLISRYLKLYKQYGDMNKMSMILNKKKIINNKKLNRKELVLKRAGIINSLGKYEININGIDDVIESLIVYREGEDEKYPTAKQISKELKRIEEEKRREKKLQKRW